MKKPQWDRPIRTEASKTWKRNDLLRMLRLMGCPDPEAGLEAILAGGEARIRGDNKKKAGALTLASLGSELSYEMRTGEGRRIDDPGFGEDDARKMARRIWNRKRLSGKETEW